jgi:uncharacterized protein YjiS (DUF1127 family)
MSAFMMTTTAIATGLASIGAVIALSLVTPAAASSDGRTRLNDFPAKGESPRLADRIMAAVRRERTRAQLTRLDDRMLRDIGLTRSMLTAAEFSRLRQSSR